MYVCRQPHRCPLYPCQLYHQTIMSLPPNCYHQSKRQKKWAVMISYHLINYRRNHVCEHLHHQCHHVINNFGIIIKCLLIVFKTATMVLIIQPCIVIVTVEISSSIIIAITVIIKSCYHQSNLQRQ